MSTYIKTNDGYYAIDIYRPIWGTDNYETTETGKVRNIKTGHILKHYRNKSGEECVTISNSYYKCRPIKRIISDAWG